MTDALTTAIVRTLDAETARVHVNPEALLRDVQARGRHAGRPARRWGSTAAVLASVAAVVAVALVIPVVRGTTSSAPAVQPSSSAAPAVPAGKQAVSWHGVQLLVPSTWKLDDARCGTPQHDTVLRSGAGLVQACGRPTVPALTVVRFEALAEREFSTGPAAAAKTPADVDGTPALRGSRVNIRDRYAVLVVPSEQVVVTASAPTLTEADALLDTARVVTVDANGCRSRLDSSRAGGPSDREGANAHLLPGDPADVSICRYAQLRLEDSRRLSPDAIAGAQRVLDALPTGRSGRVPPGEIMPAICHQIDDDVTTLDATYAAGLNLTVYLRDQACTDRSPTNGSTSRKLLGSGQSLDSYALLRGEPMRADTDRTAERPQPAPQLGYDQIGSMAGTLAAPAQRADVLARTNDDREVQLLGLTDTNDRLCVALRKPGASAATPLSCAAGKPGWVTATGLTASIDPAGDADHPLLTGAAAPEVRTVRVLVDGKQTAVLATYGGGARYDQRRFFLGRLPQPGRVELVGLDSLGFEVARTTVR